MSAIAGPGVTEASTQAAKPIAQADLFAVLEQTRDCWQQARGERIFVTGGTGFLGAWLLESFALIRRELKLDTRLTALSRRPDAFRAKMPHLFAEDCGIDLVAGDVRDFAFPEGTHKYVIAAATEASAKQLAEEPQEMWSTILTGMQHTIEFARTHGAKRLLQTSSGAVYGRQPSDVVNLPEEFAGAPDSMSVKSVYGEGKRVSEMMGALAERVYGIDQVSARIFALGGPHLPLDSHFALGNFIRDVMRGGPLVIEGDGTPTRSYLYAGDAMAWLWTMLFQAPSGRAYNLGSPESLSIRQVAEAVRDALAPEAEVEVRGQVRPDAAVSRYVPSVERAESELGVRVTVDLHATVRRTAEWYGWKQA
ncbi:NAD-dependent epimerase/dehydratase family protein [Terriglobus sp.]|uniref:NAD-dependent epimerase/dehydratase family protein n=1 Tax=Terriglobus sp. TaxID=1889013 RepID=UPI003B007C08